MGTFRLGHSGYAIAGVAAAGLLAGAWLLTRSGASATAEPAPAAEKSDVNIEQQTVELSDKQAAGFKPLPAKPRAFKVVKNAVGDTAAIFMALGGGWPAGCTTSVWRECAMRNEAVVRMTEAK